LEKNIHLKKVNHFNVLKMGYFEGILVIEVFIIVFIVVDGKSSREAFSQQNS
jgi:hypothetical protein